MCDRWDQEAERNRRLAGQPTLEQRVVELERKMCALLDAPAKRQVIWPDYPDPLGR
jgi:hypothetical protein